MKYYDNIEQLIGNTPLLKLNNIMKKHGLNANVFAKLEYFNPTGSVKDRAAAQMIKDALTLKLINEDTTIIEPTSGNTGIGLAAICANLKFKLILVMPETMSEERRNLLKAYGAKIVLSEGSKGMKGAIETANTLAEETKNSFIPSQFENPSNPNAHYNTTGPEIWNDTDGNIDVFIAGVGTGGTISGTGKYLKEQNNNIHIVAVEPEASPVLSNGKAGPHKIQGIGAGFVPNTLNTEIYDEVLCVSNENAFTTARELAHEEGILCGISSGSALYSAIETAKKPEFASKNIVVILPDTGERYLSTGVFDS